jgi:hypothetical protein
MRRVLALTTLLGAASCIDAGRGAVEFTIWGEDLVERGIPDGAFEDGWSVRFDKFLVVVRDVTVADGAEVGGRQDGAILFDLTRPGPHAVVTFRDLAAKSWPAVRFQIGPSGADVAPGPGVTDGDKALLGTASLRVIGAASRGPTQKTFDWSFTRATSFEGCRGARDGREIVGAMTTVGGVDRIQLTIHGDHLFYDDLQSADAKMRFDAIAAADVNGDGAVTLAELEGVRLDALPRDRYATGGAAGIETLGAFIASLSRTVAHFRGEGECTVKDPP